MLSHFEAVLALQVWGAAALTEAVEQLALSWGFNSAFPAPFLPLCKRCIPDTNFKGSETASLVYCPEKGAVALLIQNGSA